MNIATACIALLPGTLDSFTWGGTANPSIVTLRPDDAALAVVEYQNTLVPGFPTGFSLTLGDLTVIVDIDHGPGSVPEVMRVHAPEGILVVPPEIVVPDDTTGVVRLFCADAVPMG
jgi:hypothetical protein